MKDGLVRFEPEEKLKPIKSRVISGERKRVVVAFGQYGALIDRQIVDDVIKKILKYYPGASEAYVLRRICEHLLTEWNPK